MTPQDRELFQQALDALSEIAWSNNSQWQSARARVAITAIRAHIANTKVQEPVAQSKCIAAIEAENAELRKDAERYRWLRSLWKVDHFSTELQPDGDSHSCDAAIDAAMKEAQS